MTLWCLLFALVLGTASAGWLRGPEERIVNGQPVRSHIPFQVALIENKSVKCGGAIYSERIILTAAHCVTYSQVERLSVRAGSASWNCSGQLLAVQKAIIHEHFYSEKYQADNDIAVLLLSSPLKFDNSTKNIELAESAPCDGTPAVVSGWGSELFEPGDKDRLHSIEVTVKDRNRCQQGYNVLDALLAEDKTIDIGEDKVCASSYGDGACFGDSGGPLYTSEPTQLIGIVSGGFRCLTPGLYTNVAFFKTWIESAVSRLI
ncbi:trypsin iota-like [Drosophila biarmipes]|uniref:trypsin iota-like n=1 Tax=Drosophila biarmipes TaxID=125945 RepID=UPI0007E73ADE|nr:trypsin iota-like [Drosophila biarmipes]